MPAPAIEAKGIDLRIYPDSIQPECKSVFELFNLVLPHADKDSMKTTGLGPLHVAAVTTLYQLNPRWTRGFPDGIASDYFVNYSDYQKFLKGQADSYAAILKLLPVVNISLDINSGMLVTLIYRSTFNREQPEK